MAGYYTIHQRMHRVNPAWKHFCVDCGRLAHDWSYIGGAPDEREQWVNKNKKPTLCKFSEDQSYYEPRCRSCHMRKDKREKREDQPAG